MLQRAIKAFAGLCLTIVAACLTWALSLLMQWGCTLFVPGQTLTPTSHASSRLAILTIFAVIALMIIGLFLYYDDDGFVAAVLVMLVIVSLFYWEEVSAYVFAGTPVITLPCQIIYYLVTMLWSVGMWYIFLDDDEPS